MRNSMFIATAAFFLVYYGLRAAISTTEAFTWNNILWTAFMVYLASRGIGQALTLQKAVYGKV